MTTVTLSPGVTIAQITAAISDNNNDVVQLNNGTYSFPGEIYLTAQRTKPVVVRPVAGASVTFTHGNQLGQFIIWGGSRLITLQGITFDGYTVGNNGVIWIANAHDIVLKNLTFKNIHSSGINSYHTWAIYLSTDQGVGHNNITIANVNVVGNNKVHSGITGGGAGSGPVTITNYTASQIDDGLYFSDAPAGTYQLTIDGVKFHSVGGLDNHSIYIDGGCTGTYKNICADGNSKRFIFPASMQNLGNVQLNPVGGCGTTISQ